jgi:hypothetical protein
MGRCLLRLQQYERLMKSLLANHEVGGAVDELDAHRARRVERFADKSLGALVKALFDSYVVVEGTERSVLDEAKLPSDRISMSFQFTMQMTAERRAEVKAAIEDLVRFRNDLVHHLIEQHNVWTDEGCAAAIEHLQASYDRIDGHFHQLAEWAEHMRSAMLHAASLEQSQVFQDLVLNGIAPDGVVDWPNAGIVRALRDALRTNAVDGWLRLEEARVWIAQHDPEQLPQKYGCRTWPQVLSESRCFQLEYRSGDAGKVAWFRATR